MTSLDGQVPKRSRGQRLLAILSWRGLSIRWRFALWCGALMAIMLAAFGGAVYGMMRSYLQARTDQALFDELAEVREEIEHVGGSEPLEARLVRRFGEDVNNEYQVIRSDGAVIFRSRRLGAQALPIPPSTNFGQRHVQTIRLHGDQHWRVASQFLTARSGDLILQVAVSTWPDEASLQNLLRIMLILGPAAWAGALGGGYLLARGALLPIDRMVAAASTITAQKLDRRLQVGPRADEVSRLALALNNMIERLDVSFHEMRRFTGDAAHELRTPLAIIRNAADVGLAEPDAPPECQQLFGDILEETEHLTRLAEQLLYLAREDAGTNQVPLSPVRLDALVGDVLDHLRLVADDKGVSMDAPRLQPATVAGDADRLRRVLLNVLDNAIKYTPPGGKVTVELEESGDDAIIRVTDTGIGIAAEHLPNIFHRFYRVDSARGDESGGAGLGLAICKAIVQSHGGEISATSVPGRGTSIRIRLPRRIRDLAALSANSCATA
jgi:heavy metal sensor kinase